jgi:DNA-binding transcriptional LysR family regulator
MTFTKRCWGLLLVGLVLLAGCGEQRSTFRLLVPAQPFDHAIAAELAVVFEQNSRHRIEVVPVPAGFETPLDALEAGYADLALTSNAQPYRKGITTVMPLYPTVLLPYTCCEGPPSTPGLWARPRGSCSRKSFTA